MQIHQKKLKANTNSVKYITLSKGIILLNFGCVSVTSRDSIYIRMLHALYYTIIRAFLQSCLLMLPCLSSTVLQNEGFRFPTLAYRQVKHSKHSLEAVPFRFTWKPETWHWSNSVIIWGICAPFSNCLTELKVLMSLTLTIINEHNSVPVHWVKNSSLQVPKSLSFMTFFFFFLLGFVQINVILSFMNLHHCEIMAMFDTSFRVINVTIWEYRVTYQCFLCWEVPGFQPMLPVVTTRTRNKVKIISKTVIYWLKMLILKNWISLRKKMVCNISLGIEIRT